MLNGLFVIVRLLVGFSLVRKGIDLLPQFAVFIQSLLKASFMSISLKSRFQYVDAILRMRFTSYAGEYVGDKGRTFLPFAFSSRTFLSLFTQFLEAVLERNEPLFLRIQLEPMGEFLEGTVQISAPL